MIKGYESKVFESGEVIFDTEKPLTHTWFILEGNVSLTMLLGSKSIKLTIGENNFIGDAAVVVQQKNDIEKIKYRARAVADNHVNAVSIPIDHIKQELEDCSPLLKAWLASFVSRVMGIIESITDECDCKDNSKGV